MKGTHLLLIVNTSQWLWKTELHLTNWCPVTSVLERVWVPFNLSIKGSVIVGEALEAVVSLTPVIGDF